MSNVRISELNQISLITTDDFIPIVDSGSLTTYRASAQLLLNLISVSGSVPLATVASSSISASIASKAMAAVSSSWASASLSSSFLIYNNVTGVNNGTASFAITASRANTSSFAITSSWADNTGNVLFASSSSASLFSVSSSWASASLSSSRAITASYAISASVATTASYAKTASLAVTALTASYITASALAGSLPGLIKAWALCACTASLPGNSIQLAPGINANVMALVQSYNVASVIRTMGVRPEDPANGEVYTGQGQNQHWLVTLSTPMPSTNYIVLDGGGGEGGPEGSNVTVFPFAPKTTTQFTLSMAGNSNIDWSGGSEIDWFSFMILSL